MQNRRKFLKNSLLTVTGAGLVSRSLPQSLVGNESAEQDTKFVYRTLGKTGIRLPVISMGTGNTDNPSLVRQALEKGVKLLATAEAYQNGNNEKMVGSVLKDKPRDSFVIMTNSTDINLLDTQTGVYNSGFDPKVYMQRVDNSLERLEVDYVDIFIQPFAATRESVFHEPARKAMENIKKMGKAKYLGIATHRLEHEAIRAAVDIGMYDVIMTAYNFRRQNKEELDDAIQYAAESGLGIIAMKTMAGAFWDREKTKPINSTAALKWVLQNKNVHTTVPDCSSYDHLNQDLAIMANLELTEEEKKDLEPPSGDVSSGLYCEQCSSCIRQCPEDIDIPTIMRSYMYAYGYRNLDLARKTLCSSGLRTLPCHDCDNCNVKCTMGFDIRSRILDIARLQDVPEDLIRHA
ncbi:MAG: aldo/keto reductase [Bacteroidales bacterium]|nr:MAG: aldo/keto reductase [Bacteroidales bacterium]